MGAERADARPQPGPSPSTATDHPRPDHRVIDGVAVLHWPADVEDRAALAAAGTPRIFVVDDGEAPPLVWERGEDWVRTGAGPGEVASRVARLATVPPAAAPAAVPIPVLDADGILRAADGRWVAIPPIEARILAPLLDRPGQVGHRADLQAGAWPRGDVGERTLDGRVKLLRRRVAPLGIRIHTVRGLGYLLEAVPPP